MTYWCESGRIVHLPDADHPQLHGYSKHKTSLSIRRQRRALAGLRIGIEAAKGIYNGGDTLVKIAGLPRTYGVTAGYSFGR
jgi:hypothetical protein